MAAESGANRLSYSSSGPRELWPGVSNYVLQVLSRRRRSRGDDHDPALLMYFLDSGGGSYTEVVSSAQVKWFHSQSRFLNPNGRLAMAVSNCVFSSHKLLLCGKTVFFHHNNVKYQHDPYFPPC
jgi:hypothetical protein